MNHKIDILPLFNSFIKENNYGKNNIERQSD